MHELQLSFPRGPARTCRVRVGSGVLAQLPGDLAGAGRPARVVVLADAVVLPLHAAPLAGALARHGLAVELLGFPAGEARKVRETKAALEDRLLALGVGRDAVFVAVGGGVTGDLVGFLAATWQRGVPVVQVPTTLLAMVDSALGGKTGVDLPGAKNFIGCFHQPRGVYADVTLLATLAAETYVDGLAEAVKSAVVADARLFRWLETSVATLLARDTDALETLVTACMRIKARVVRRDERDLGPRAALNFGHTVAHAIEAASGFTVRHGRAVAVGLRVESELAHEAAGLPPAHGRRIASLLGAFGLPTRIPSELSVERIVEATRRDKKARAGATRYALPARLGRMVGGCVVRLSEDVLRRAIERVQRDEPQP